MLQAEALAKQEVAIRARRVAAAELERLQGNSSDNIDNSSVSIENMSYVFGSLITTTLYCFLFVYIEVVTVLCFTRSVSVFL